MKRNLLAIAIPALLVAGAANASIEIWNKDGNKLDLYGRVYALNYLGDKGNTVDGEGDKTTARIGFSGETQVTDTLSGYGRFEWETHTGKNAQDETRYAFAGLNFGQYGSIDYGRNDGVLKSLTAYTDVLPEFGGNASNNGLYVLSARTDGVATYRNSGFYGLVDGLDFAIQYGDSKQIDEPLANQTTDEIFGSKESYGMSAQYSILDTGLTVGAGYATTSKAKTDERAKSWMGGIKYDAYDLYLAALYSHTSYDDVKIKGVELVAQYGIDFEIGRLTPSLAYIQHKTDGSDADLIKYVDVGLQYDFNKNLTALVDYKINLLDKEDIGAGNIKANTKDTVALGLIYQF
ncbi:porin [Orbus wheelerorum]|uniref:porin n=1 Tax=Orbus wheelerorum TaxID=3074111 RepID=UPI00370D9232